MDRKVIKKKSLHTDKPPHQRWLYQLSDLGLIKATLIIWGACWAIIGITMLLIKAILKINQN